MASEFNPGRKRSNHAGSQNSTLGMIKNVVAKLKYTGKNDANAINFILDAISLQQENLGQYVLNVASANNDTIIEKINDSLIKLFDAWVQRLSDSGSGASGDSSSLIDAIENILITNNYVKTNTDEIKEKLQLLVSKEESEDAKLTYENKEVSSLEDEKVKDYKDSTVAKNFSVIEDRINKQFNELNNKLKDIGNISFIGSMFSLVVGGFTVMKTLMSKTASGIGKLTKTIVSPILDIGSVIKNGFFTGISKSIGLVVGAVTGIGAGISFLKNGITGFGKKLGNVIATPFKAIGGWFSRKNKPDIQERKKQMLREKIQDKIAKVVDKIVDMLEPFISTLLRFSSFIIVPILAMAANVLLIIAAIAAIGLGLYLAYQWLKPYITKFIEWIKPYISKLWEWIQWTWNEILWPALQAMWDGLVMLWDGIKWTWDKILWPTLKMIWDGLVILWDGIKWIWNKILWPAIKFIWDGIMFIWDGIKQLFTAEFWKDVGKKIWEGMKAFGEKIANGYKATKTYIKDKFISIKTWIKTKITEIKQWIFDKIINPMKTWINDKLVKPITTFYDEKIKPHVDPFIASIQNFIDRIRSAFSAWDTNKSVWENLTNLSSIIIDSIGEWWETSPFKQIYDEHIAPLVESVMNLIQRIKDIWNNFHWDETKSFLENLQGFWDNIKQAIKDWWRDSPIRNIWEKVSDWILNMWEKIKEKFLATKFGQWILGAIDKIKELKEQLGNTEWSFLGKKFYPFGFLVGKNLSGENEAEKLERERQEKLAKINEQMVKLQERLNTGDYGSGKWYDPRATKEDIENELTIAQAEAAELAKQQITPSIETVNSITNNNLDNSELEDTTEEISEKMDAANKATVEFQNQQRAFGSQYLQQLDLLNQKLDTYGQKQPAVVPMPIAYPAGPYNNANMGSF